MDANTASEKGRTVTKANTAQQRKRRANMTPEQIEEKRRKNREYKRLKRASMSEEELEALRAKRREQEKTRRANRSPEKIEADKEKARERAKRRYYSNPEYREELKARHREWYQAMKASPEKHAGFRARQRAYEKQWRAQRTPEQRERDRASDRRRQRKRSLTRTPAQKEAKNAYERDYHFKKWFEREKARTLGVYKKIWTDLTPKQIEQRYNLHLLWRSQMCTTCTPGEPEWSCIACSLHSANNKR